MSPQFLTYNALDSACTKQIHDAIWADLHDGGYYSTYQATVDLFPVLLFMQTRGIKVNLDALAETKTEILQAANERQHELDCLCGRALNVNSPKDCQQYFYIEKGIPPYHNQGNVTVDDLALQRMARGTARRAGLREAKLVQEIRGLHKLHGTYLNITFDADNRFRCSYNPRGTKFGRLSSSKTIFDTGMNAQNLPEEFKKFLVADDGYVFVNLDKRQAEWIVVAYLSGDANMIRVIEEGRDTHIHTASLMFGIPPEILELESKLVGMNSDPDLIYDLRKAEASLETFMHVLPRTMSGRQCGKKSNHGLNYDEGAFQFALINELEPNEGKRIVNMYHLIYPGIKVWYNAIQRQLQKERTLTNCFGRKVRFMDAWGPDLFKAAYSMLPQSTVVDSLNQGMVKIYSSEDICRRLNVDVLAQVHDSILLQVPIDVIRGPEFAQLQEMCYDYCSPEITYNGRTFRIPTDMKIGLNWGAHHKVNNTRGMQDVKSMSEVPEILRGLGVA